MHNRYFNGMCLVSFGFLRVLLDITILELSTPPLLEAYNYLSQLDNDLLAQKNRPMQSRSPISQWNYHHKATYQ